MFWLSPVHHFINRLLGTFTSKIICVSDSVKKYSLENDKITEAKYSIIYNGVNTNNYIPRAPLNEEYRSEFGLNKNDIIIGNVGVLSVRKGQKYLVSAFKRLSERFDNVKLLIFGSRREHELKVADELYDLINKLALNDKVKIFSPRKDLNKIYNIFDLFVMPSITEGLSLSAIEAMLMERICLFSDIPPFKEMINEGINGFMFRSADEGDLFNKMEYIIKNITSFKEAGRKARVDALAKYTSGRMVNEYKALYLS